MASHHGQGTCFFFFRLCRRSPMELLSRAAEEISAFRGTSQSVGGLSVRCTKNEHEHEHERRERRDSLLRCDPDDTMQQQMQ